MAPVRRLRLTGPREDDPMNHRTAWPDRAVRSGALLLVLLAMARAQPAPCTPAWTQGVFPVPGVTSPVYGSVNACLVHDDGTGPALYVAGMFTAAGLAAAPGVARWNGTAWSAVGSGLNGTARALAVYDDGSGPALYVAG